MDYFISFIAAFLFGGCTLVIGVQNPIHSILILILVFFLGSILLFTLHVEYFALLFMIVYVGAIVVLFLFIVMMLEIKMVNLSERFKDLFSYKNIIIAFFLLEVLLFGSADYLDFMSIFSVIKNENVALALLESNLFMDYSKLIQPTDHLRAIGGVLFTEYKLTVMIAALLLFLAMVGSIVMTLEQVFSKTLKSQNANHQTLRSSTKLSLYSFSKNTKNSEKIKW